MLKNYLKVAFRNLRRHKVNSAINILGLTVALVAFIIIGLYLRHEFSYDGMYPDADRVYRVNTDRGNSGHIEITSPRIREIINGEIPEIEYASIYMSMFYERPVKWNEKLHTDFKMVAVDSDFIDMFGLSIISGSTAGVFSGPNAVLIEESLAARVFGKSNPIGETIVIPRNGQNYLFEVKGIYQKLPSNTYFNSSVWNNFDIITSIETLYDIDGDRAGWNSLMTSAFIQLREGVEESVVTSKVNDLLKRNAGSEIEYTHYLQPLTDVYLNRRGDEVNQEGDINRLYLFMSIAVLILLIACVNYVNITTAQAMTRFKEIGVRKVIGAKKPQFVLQFLIEAALTSFISLSLALLIVFLLMPNINTAFSLDLDFRLTNDMSLLVGFLLTIILVSLVCGTYPGFHLSRVDMGNLLKANTFGKSGRGILRKILVVLQFAVSISLIVATLVVADQLEFISTKDKGFNEDQVVNIKLDDRRYTELLFNKIKQVKGVLGVSVSGNTLGDGFVPKSPVIIGDNKAGDKQYQGTMTVGYDYLEVLGLEMNQGRWFSRDLTTDKGAYVVNQAFVDFYNLENPIDQIITRNGRKGVIIGVTKDFHFRSVKHIIEPLIMRISDINTYGYGYLTVKLSAANIDESMREIQAGWESIVPESAFAFEFLDQKIDRLYKPERDFGLMFKGFAALTIIISCLGLIGLISFSTKKRLKEIGMRKVLGASTTRILSLISKELFISILVGAIVAIPVSYLFMEQWLENFEYRIQVSVWSFALAIVMTAIISWLSVSYIALKVARSNPIESIKRV